jgi:hypothetical protein
MNVMKLMVVALAGWINPPAETKGQSGRYGNSIRPHTPERFLIYEFQEDPAGAVTVSCTWWNQSESLNDS